MFNTFSSTIRAWCGLSGSTGSPCHETEIKAEQIFPLSSSKQQSIYQAIEKIRTTADEFFELPNRLRDFEKVREWMRDSVTIFVNSETTLTDQKLLAHLIAREINLGGRVSRIGFFDAIRTIGEDNLTPWADLLQLTPKVYKALLDPKALASLSGNKSKYPILIEARFFGFAQEFAFIDTYEDMVRVCAPSFFVAAHAENLKHRMRSYGHSRDQSDLNVGWNLDPKTTVLAPNIAGLQYGDRLFLIDIKDRAEVQREVDTICLNLTHIPKEAVCDLITFACTHQAPSSELAVFLRHHLPTIDASAIDSQLRRLSTLVLGEPREVNLRVSRIDRPPEPDQMNSTDYARMVTDPLRSMVERAFGITLASLALQEQFYLLTALKEFSHEKTTSLSNLLRSYGEEAIRAFVVCEYDSSLGEELLSALSQMPQANAKALLATFSGGLDALWKFSGNLQDRSLGEELHSTLSEVSKQIEEGFLRRMTDIFVAGIRAGSTETSWPSTPDVVRALEGIRVLLNVLADTSQKSQFEYERIDPSGVNSQPENLIYSVVDRASSEQMKLKMLFRPKATETGQARWNIELEFQNQATSSENYRAFLHSMHYMKDGRTATKSVLRCGLDCDTSGEAARISLDVGRGPFAGNSYQTEGCLVGRILTKAAAESGGHHNRLSFERDLADGQRFEQIIISLKKYFEKLDVSPAL